MMRAARSRPARVQHEIYAGAMRQLREFTRSPPERDLVSVLIRAAVLSPAAARSLVRSEMRTRSHRRAAAVAAAVAIAAELDGAAE